MHGTKLCYDKMLALFEAIEELNKSHGKASE